MQRQPLPLAREDIQHPFAVIAGIPLPNQEGVILNQREEGIPPSQRAQYVARLPIRRGAFDDALESSLDARPMRVYFVRRDVDQSDAEQAPALPPVVPDAAPPADPVVCVAVPAPKLKTSMFPPSPPVPPVPLMPAPLLVPPLPPAPPAALMTFDADPVTVPNAQ